MCVCVCMFVYCRNYGLALVLLVTSCIGLGRSPALVLISTLKYRASDQLRLLQHLKILCTTQVYPFFFLIFFFLNFIFKLYITVLDLPNIKMNPPQVYMCSPS